MKLKLTEDELALLAMIVVMSGGENCRGKALVEVIEKGLATILRHRRESAKVNFCYTRH